MVSFEIIDNMFQVAVMLTCFLTSVFFAVKRKDEMFTSLAGMYGSFMIGTLFYSLHLIIIGETPHISYCAEISWLTTFLFMMQIIIQRTGGSGKNFSLKAAAGAALVVASALYNEVLGPMLLFVIAFAGISGITVYLAIWRIEESRREGRRVSCLEVFIPVIICLDILVYYVSSFYSDLTHFNLYFAIDILLTISCALMLVFYVREERWNR
ncbi:MAG: hypothetical protein ACI4LC_02570 [Emergencia sp.]